MGRTHILSAHSIENEGNVCRVAAQVCNTGPHKVASKPQEHKEKQLSHHHLKFTEFLVLLQEQHGRTV